MGWNELNLTAEEARWMDNHPRMDDRGPSWRPHEPIMPVIESSDPRAARTVGLPKDDKSRKALPIFRGVVMYFPDALAAVAAVSKAGNDQHNPGEPLHWAREKSTEQMDTAMRHMMDHGLGNIKDTDGTYHLAKAVWRLMAELQLTIERASEPLERG